MVLIKYEGSGSIPAVSYILSPLKRGTKNLSDLLKPATAATGGRVRKAGDRDCVKLWLAGIFSLSALTAIIVFYRNCMLGNVTQHSISIFLHAFHYTAVICSQIASKHCSLLLLS